MQGRKSLYKSSYCDLLIEHMSQGNSFRSFGAIVNVSRDCLYKWTSRYPEFAEAKGVALCKNLLYLENLAINNMHSKSFNTGIWMYFMKNMHGWSHNPISTTNEKPESRLIIVNKETEI